MADKLSESQVFGHTNTNSEGNATQISGLNQEQHLVRGILNDDSTQNNAFKGKNSHNTYIYLLILQAYCKRGEGPRGTLCPPHYYVPSQIFRPCDGPVLCRHTKKQIDHNFEQKSAF